MGVCDELEREALRVFTALVQEEGLQEGAIDAEHAVDLAAEVLTRTPPLAPARARRMVAEEPEWLLRSCELPASTSISALDVLQHLVVEHLVGVVLAAAGRDPARERTLEWPVCPRPAATRG
jgi:hypothetical protein